MVKLSKYVAVISSVFLSSSSFAMPEVKLISPVHPAVQEVSASYFPTSDNGIPSYLSPILIPSMRTFSQFGGVTPVNDKDFPENSKTKRIFRNARPVCGSSPYTNSLNCFDLLHGGIYLGTYPVPGRLSATPVFYDRSWLFATAKGFLMRVDANPDNYFLPNLSGKSTALWGAYSRQMMASFRPKTLYINSEEEQSKKDDSGNKSQGDLPVGTKWIYPSSGIFIGTPVIANGFVYALSTTQYLQSFDWSTGKLVWAVHLSPDAKLQLSSNALAVTDSEVIAGTDLGSVMVFSPQSGSLLWTIDIPSATNEQRAQMMLSAAPDRYASVVAPPLVINRNIIVSNVESMTQNISLDSHTPVWSYPIGSIAQAKVYRDNIILAGSNGKVISLNQKTGALNWATSVMSDHSSIVSVFLTKSNVILAASWRGQIFMLEPDTGKILAQNMPIGETSGEFFTAYNDADACLSYSHNGFRCFRAKIR